MGDIFLFSGEEVIYGDNLVVMLDEEVCKMAADKAGTTSKDNAHLFLLRARREKKVSLTPSEFPSAFYKQAKIFSRKMRIL